MADEVTRKCRELFEAKHRGGPMSFARDDGDDTPYYSSATRHEFADALEFFARGIEFQQARDKQTRGRVEALTVQLAAQRAVVAADNEYYRVRTECRGPMAIDAASRVCRERREAAKRIDKEAT